MIEEGAYQHVLPGEASVDERGDVPEDSSSASVGLFRGPEHVDELVHEGRHRPAAAPPRALGISSARARRRGRHLGLFSPETPAPAGGPAGRAYLADSSRHEPRVRESKRDARLSSARPLEVVDLPSPTPAPSPEDSLSRGGKIQLCT